MRGKLAIASTLVSITLGGVVTAQEPTSRRPPVVVGRVVADGEPVAGALVILAWLAHPELPGSIVPVLGGDGRERRVVTSDGAGMFRFDAPNHGPFAVHATDGRGRTSTRRFPVMARDFVELTLLPDRYVSGRVTDVDGKPIAGAKVSTNVRTSSGSQLERYRNPLVPVPSLTGADGRFRIPIVESDRSSQHAVERSLLAWTDDRISTQSIYRIDEQVLGDVALPLDGSPVARGRVVDSNRRPIAGAVVLDILATGRRVESAADGSFVLDGLREKQVLVRAPGFMGGVARTDSDADVVLMPGLRLECEVTLDTRELTGARVLVATTTTDPAIIPCAWTTELAPEGHLVLDGLAPGVPVCAWLDVDGEFVPILARVAGSESRKLGTIPVARNRHLEGQVLDSRGLPKRGARVLLQTLLPAPDEATRAGIGVLPLPYRVTYTDHGGRYRFDQIGDGGFLVGVDGGEDGFTTRRVFGRRAREPIEIRLGTGTTRSGRITLPGGAPARGARVQYIASFGGGNEDDAARFGTCYLFGLASDDGTFEFRGLPQHTSATVYGMVTDNGAGFIGFTVQTADNDGAIALELHPHDGRL